MNRRSKNALVLPLFHFFPFDVRCSLLSFGHTVIRPIGREGILSSEIRKESRTTFHAGRALFRELHIEPFKTQFQGVPVNAVEFFSMDGSVQIIQLLRAHRCILGHEAEGQARSEL